MAKEPHIYQKDGLGWYIQTSSSLEGPVESSQAAQQFLQLILLVNAARTECACLDRECL